MLPVVNVARRALLVTTYATRRGNHVRVRSADAAESYGRHGEEEGRSRRRRRLDDS